jgi:hypothetical protein
MKTMINTENHFFIPASLRGFFQSPGTCPAKSRAGVYPLRRDLIQMRRNVIHTRLIQLHGRCIDPLLELSFTIEQRDNAMEKIGFFRKKSVFVTRPAWVCFFPGVWPENV